ncbi:SIMPL domain-containing protein [Flavitalea sp.]|nr:SIMPL domain-containing protein [Flavitalea sp.]
MKRFILALSTVLAMLVSNAQTLPPKVFPKTIQVTGIAELNIAPDEIHVLITLKEYEKKNKSKIDIETIRKDFLASVRKIGIADTAIRIMSVDGNSGLAWWRRKNQKDELYAAITYEIVFNNAQKIDELINLLDDEATQQFTVSEITHSNLVNLQKQLRMDAMKAAKTKAIYLAESISENIGSAITITETTFPQVFDNMKRFSNTMAVINDEPGDLSKPEFKKLILKAEMNVIFELR